MYTVYRFDVTLEWHLRCSSFHVRTSPPRVPSDPSRWSVDDSPSSFAVEDDPRLEDDPWCIHNSRQQTNFLRTDTLYFHCLDVVHCNQLQVEHVFSCDGSYRWHIEEWRLMTLFPNLLWFCPPKNYVTSWDAHTVLCIIIHITWFIFNYAQ